MLAELYELTQEDGETKSFSDRINELRGKYANKTSFIRQLNATSLPKS